MNSVKVISIISLILAFSVSYVYADKKVKEVKVENVKGLAIGSHSETIEEITNRAVNEAKTEAMRRAGVAENISSFSDYFQVEENYNYEELFTSDVLSDIQGSVKDVEVIDTKRSFDESGSLKIEVIINCTVLKYETEKDIAFDVFIEGFGMFYPSGSNLKFTIKPSKNAYVKLFIFSESEAFVLFPNDYEQSELFNANQEYLFPRNYAFDYTFESDKKSEIHRAVFVFMKEDIPYTGDVEYKKIIDWIFSIPPDIRVIKSFGFSVVNEDKMKED